MFLGMITYNGKKKTLINLMESDRMQYHRCLYVSSALTHGTARRLFLLKESLIDIQKQNQLRPYPSAFPNGQITA